jgi:membrane-bound ClpP family serine protease
MWVVAGVLLGLVVLASLAGVHTGPHTHLAAGVLGIAAAIWLLVMAGSGRSAPILWVLLSADLIVSAGVGFMAWFGLSGRATAGHRPIRLEGAEGVAVGDLTPEGIVRVRGEEWSAVCVNGTVRAGHPVQVLRTAGVRLQVWGEDADSLPEQPFGLGEGASKEQTP